MLTTLPPSCANCLEIWEPQLRGNPQGLTRPVMGLLYLFNILGPPSYMWSVVNRNLLMWRMTV